MTFSSAALKTLIESASEYQFGGGGGGDKGRVEIE